ncbi:MAG TPA: hypothetical protein V6D17_03640 [Candidatus Obscuribacterales bacterium]
MTQEHGDQAEQHGADGAKDPQIDPRDVQKQSGSREAKSKRSLAKAMLEISLDRFHWRNDPHGMSSLFNTAATPPAEGKAKNKSGTDAATAKNQSKSSDKVDEKPERMAKVPAEPKAKEGRRNIEVARGLEWMIDPQGMSSPFGYPAAPAVHSETSGASPDTEIQPAQEAKQIAAPPAWQGEPRAQPADPCKTGGIHAVDKAASAKCKSTKTILDIPVGDLEGLRFTVTKQATASSTETRKKSRQFKTMLDHASLMQAVAARNERKLAELIRERESRKDVPPEPIANFKLAGSCPWKWEDADSRERFRYCGKCQATVYNFDGMALSQAQALIFKRENKRNAPLYKRADGKFMTSDCPLHLAKRRRMVVLAIAAILLLIGTIGLISIMPRPQEAVVSDTMPEQSDTTKAPGEPKIIEPTFESKDGSFHYEAGKGFTSPPTNGSAETPPQAPSQPAAPDPDESGKFWQYESGPGGRIDEPESTPSYTTQTQTQQPQAPATSSQPQAPATAP